MCELTLLTYFAVKTLLWNNRFVFNISKQIILPHKFRPFKLIARQKSAFFLLSASLVFLGSFFYTDFIWDSYFYMKTVEII